MRECERSNYYELSYHRQSVRWYRRGAWQIHEREDCSEPAVHKEQLLAEIADVDVLIMRVDPKIDKEILDAAKNLKVIGVCSVGLNHIDMEYAKEKGIQIFNAPGLNANAVAELTISKMLDISRGTMTANYDVKVKHEWDKYKFVGRELRGKTLGVMGFGRIGRRVGELGRAFGMNIVAYDPYLKPEDFEKENAVGMGVEELLKVSDFVSIHVPLTDETEPVQREIPRGHEGRRSGSQHEPRRHRVEREGYVRGS